MAHRVEFRGPTVCPTCGQGEPQDKVYILVCDACGVEGEPGVDPLWLSHQEDGFSKLDACSVPCLRILMDRWFVGHAPR